jgi:hypothetical protein
VAPAGKGSVTFSVRVKDGLASGTEIVNHADVYFPSSSEITPTNAVVSIVRTIAADPKTVETTSGTPVPITLTGSDSGSAAITYRVTTGPLYGALSGILPSAVYTSMAAFTGQDEFYYVVNNGTVDSDPARVTIRVNPNPADTTAPAVASTWPAAETRSVHIDPNAIAPSRYIPTITATFSEGLDATTVTASTFTVGGLTGTVSYYDETRTAYFVPSTALAYSTVYTAQITTGVKDKNGNAMGASYTWQFTTESPANISVALSNNAEILAFGSILTGYSIPGMTVSILSTGSINLTLGAIEKAGTNPDEFEVSQDSCTGQTLEHFANCTLKVAFRPRSAGPKTAELSIGSNDADENPKLVSMTGTGFAFNDVPFPYWAGNHINSLFRSGITAGCSTDPPMFCPDNTINRWQMAVFMETSLGRAPAATCTDMFSDVNARTVGDLVCRYIEDFAAAGITGGCGEGRFCPHEPVTRAQMAVFIEAALGRSPATSCAGRFNDVSIGGVGEAFCRFIEDFADQGITGGCPASPPMFCPNAPVTRAQMAIFLVAAPPPLSP